MNADSIVVMEAGADWPAWVDREAGRVSSIVVLAREPRERLRDFEQRVTERLARAANGARRGVLVASHDSSRDATTSRAHLLRALVAMVKSAGGGEVVLVGEDSTRTVAEASSFAERLNRRGGGCVSLVSRKPPANARRVA